MYSSFAFTLGHFSKAGTVFFLVSMALSTFLDINIYAIVLILGVTIIILTLLGVWKQSYGWTWLREACS